jgi:hypothetical protein
VNRGLGRVADGDGVDWDVTGVGDAFRRKAVIEDGVIVGSDCSKCGALLKDSGGVFMKQGVAAQMVVA